MDDQMGEVVRKTLPLLGGLALKGLTGKDDVADQPLNGCKGIELGEAQDIGGLVDFPPIAIEDALMGIVGEHNGDLGGPDHLRTGPGEGVANRLFSKRIKVFGPIARLDGDGDFERRAGRQRDLSSLAVAPS